MRTLSILSAGLLLASTAFADDAAPAAQHTFKLKSGAGAITYKIVHKLHEVEGRTQSLVGSALLKPDGTLQVAVRAPVASFDSGDGNRDEHMREVMEDAKYPNVTFKGVAHVKVPATLPAKVETTVEGELDFHGRKHRERVPVTLEFRSPTEMQATASFNVSLDQYEVERPSMLFMKIDDACRVVLDLTLAEEK